MVKLKLFETGMTNPLIWSQIYLLRSYLSTTDCFILSNSNQGFALTVMVAIQKSGHVHSGLQCTVDSR